MEIMNECSVILLTYGLMSFTDFVPDEEVRYEIGYVYMGVTLINIMVHLIFLLLGTAQKIKLVCKRKFRCCRPRALSETVVSKAPLPEGENLEV